MTGVNQDRASMTEAANDRFSRTATKHARSLHYRFWLSAEVRMAAIYVGFSSSSGNSDAVFPLLEALRTKPDVPWTAADDPKQS